jgi:MFS transporter, ACS family, glucarate transporter
MNRRWALVALLSATATASYLARVNVSVAGLRMMQELGLSQQDMGRVFSAFLLGYALCQIPGGMLADRYGARRVLAAAALGWVAATVWISWAGAVMALLLAGRFLLGVAESPTFPGAARAVSHWVPEGMRGRANGFVVAAIGLGSALAPPLLTFVMERWGWRNALLVSGVPALVVGLLWLRVQTPRETVTTHVSVRGLPRGHSFILLTASYTLQGYVGYIFVYWFYLYLIQVRHFTVLESAWMGSLPWLLSIVSIPLGGWLFDRFSQWRRALPLAGLTGSGLLIALGATWNNAWGAAACLALATGLVLSVEGPFWTAMTAIAGERSGAAGGVMNTGSNLGGLISPALTPVLAARFGWETALLISAALAVAAGLMWWWIDPRGEAVTPQP